MMLNNNVKMALSSLKATKWRSVLTMLGVIIGVASVVTTVSIGEGLRQQVLGQIHDLGPDLITVRPGQVVSRDEAGQITGINYFKLFNTGTLSEEDWKDIDSLEAVDVAVPVNVVTGTVTYGDRTYDNGFVMATTPDVPQILHTPVAYGEFFKEGDRNDNFAVIGKRVAEELFKENVPIGKSLEIRGQSFIVRGVFDEFTTSPLVPAADYNTAVFIPYEAGSRITDRQTQILQILAQPAENTEGDDVVAAITDKLTENHGGRSDFTVLKQEENLAIANNVLTMLTALIAGVAAISLLVGGIGIMNIMLVSVTERTQEIGIRKAVGATNRQIASQFMVEAAILSLTGGFLGVLTALFFNYLLRIFTDLQPVITLPVVGVATTVALMVGIIFGTMPAVRAARKDPIEALRYNQ
jgi:putative ABC transport system permease protein